MKKLIVIVCMTIVSLGAYAQPGGGGRRSAPDPAEMIARASENLDLSDSQVAEWETIHEKYEDELKSARGNREEGKAVREKMQAELEATLTDEQKVKFAEMKSNRQERGGRGNRG
ncbi:MAG: hypothetical protein RIF33_25330 [Cyclobacteriaceae bacterium]